MDTVREKAGEKSGAKTTGIIISCSLSLAIFRQALMGLYIRKAPVYVMDIKDNCNNNNVLKIVLKLKKLLNYIENSTEEQYRMSDFFVS